MNTRIRLILLSVILFGSQHFFYAQSLNSDMRNLANGADVIVTGKVTGHQSGWNNDRTMISTSVTVKVNDLIKGYDEGGTITFIYPGGEVGEIGEFYTHVPVFKVDEEVLVFLKKHSDQSYRVYEGESGKIMLYKDNISGKTVTAGNKNIEELINEIKSYEQR